MAASRKQDSTQEKPDGPERRGSDDRRTGGDRRSGKERRLRDVKVENDRRTGKDRRQAGPEGERRKVERRINEYVLEPLVLEFINAVNDYKSVNQRPFPTWTEIYKIFISLGYRKGD